MDRVISDAELSSSNRIGFEWLLTPLMTFQNCHLVHHLYPRAPFYRIIKLWNSRRDLHLSKDSLLIDALSLSKIKS